MVDLDGTSVVGILKRGTKKILMELTSVKFLLLVFMAVCTWFGKIEPIYGIPAMLLLVGIKEGAEAISKFTEK